MSNLLSSAAFIALCKFAQDTVLFIKIIIYQNIIVKVKNCQEIVNPFLNRSNYKQKLIKYRHKIQPRRAVRFPQVKRTY